VRNSAGKEGFDLCMKAGPSSDLPQGSDLDPRHEAVWRLLGRTPMAEPDAWFAARTLARCRSEKQTGLSFGRVWRWALGGGLGIQTPSADQQKNVQEAFEIMASIDNSDTDSSASSTSWQDSSL
jgi:hypothetical protein